jgi:hypothetical protein
MEWLYCISLFEKETPITNDNWTHCLNCLWISVWISFLDLQTIWNTDDRKVCCIKYYIRYLCLTLRTKTFWKIKKSSPWKVFLSFFHIYSSYSWIISGFYTSYWQLRLLYKSPIAMKTVLSYLYVNSLWGVHTFLTKSEWNLKEIFTWIHAMILKTKPIAQLFQFIKPGNICSVLVPQACNPSCLGRWNQEDLFLLEVSLGKQDMRLHLQNNQNKMDCGCDSSGRKPACKHKTMSSNLNPTKKKKKNWLHLCLN